MYSVGDLIAGKAQYRIVRKFGDNEKGGIADLYVVESLDSGNQYILKLNRKNPAAKITEIELLREVKVQLKIANLDKRVVDPIEALGEIEPGKVGHIESIAPGQSCSKSRPSEKQAIQLALEFAEVLRVCASNSIAYRDIKFLQHLFWEDDPWKITIIDWNASIANASAQELLDDYLEFCRRLPELFTGLFSDENFDTFHPLEWDFHQTHYLISYATWNILAKFSLNLGAPVYPRLRDLFGPSKLSDSDEADQKLLVVRLWDDLVLDLQRVFELFNVKGSSFDSTDPFQTLMFESVNGVISDAGIDSLNSFFETARNRLKNLKITSDSLSLRLEDIDNLRRAEPRNMRVWLLRILCSLWYVESIKFQNASAKKFDQLMENLVDAMRRDDAKSLGNLLAPNWYAGIEIDSTNKAWQGTLQGLWDRIFYRLDRELRIWAFTQTLNLDDPGKSLLELEGFISQYPKHPSLLDLRENLQITSNRSRAIAAAREHLEVAYAQLNQKNIKKYAAELQKLTGVGSKDYQIAKRYLDQIEIIGKVQSALSSWDENLIDICLANLQVGVFDAKSTDKIGALLNERKGALAALRGEERYILEHASMLPTDGIAELAIHGLQELYSKYITLRISYRGFSNSPDAKLIHQALSFPFIKLGKRLLEQTNMVNSDKTAKEDVQELITLVDTLLSMVEIQNQLTPDDQIIASDLKSEKNRLESLVSSQTAAEERREREYRASAEDPSISWEDRTLLFEALSSQLREKYRVDHYASWMKYLRQKLATYIENREYESAKDFLEKAKEKINPVSEATLELDEFDRKIRAGLANRYADSLIQNYETLETDLAKAEHFLENLSDKNKYNKLLEIIKQKQSSSDILSSLKNLEDEASKSGEEMSRLRDQLARNMRLQLGCLILVAIVLAVPMGFLLSRSGQLGTIYTPAVNLTPTNAALSLTEPISAGAITETLTPEPISTVTPTLSITNTPRTELVNSQITLSEGTKIFAEDKTTILGVVENGTWSDGSPYIFVFKEFEGPLDGWYKIRGQFIVKKIFISPDQTMITDNGGSWPRLIPAPVPGNAVPEGFTGGILMNNKWILADYRFSLSSLTETNQLSKDYYQLELVFLVNEADINK